VPRESRAERKKRVNQRLRLTSEDDPVKIERELMELIPRKEWTGSAAARTK
jgi:endonuclease III